MVPPPSFLMVAISRSLTPTSSHWPEVNQLYWFSKNQVWGFLIFLIAFFFFLTPQLPLPAWTISLLLLPLVRLFFFFCVLRCESWDPRVKPFLSFSHRPSGDKRFPWVPPEWHVLALSAGCSFSSCWEHSPISLLSFFLFKSMLLSFQILGDFPRIFLLLIYNLIPLWSKHILYRAWILLNLLRLM